MGPALIHGYSEGLHDIVLPVAHARVGVEVERGRSGSGRGRMEAECGRGLPRGADEGETRGRRAGGESYHDTECLSRNVIAYESKYIHGGTLPE